MSRFRKPGGHRRKVKKETGTARKFRHDTARRAQEIDGCRFPSVCGCPQCDPDAGDNDNEEGQ
jgi:hypothetical protein